LFAPYWRPDARGAIVGLTRYATRHHLARAVLEACAYQTKDIVLAMNKDSGVDLKSLKVDGGMVVNDLLMQLQSDILDVPVIRPMVTETTCLGAAYAETGDFDSARKFSRQAVEKGKQGDDEVAEQLAAELESYEAAKPWRERQEMAEAAAAARAGKDRDDDSAEQPAAAEPAPRRPFIDD